MQFKEKETITTDRVEVRGAGLAWDSLNGKPLCTGLYEP